MLTSLEKSVFVIAILVSAGMTLRNFGLVYKIVRRGRPDLQLNALPKRVVRALTVFVSQRTVLRTRLVSSLLHALVAWGFIYYFWVNVGDVLEGFIPGFLFLGRSLVGNLYRLGADLLTVGVLVGMACLLFRRFVARPATLSFHENVMVHPKALRGMRVDSLVVGLFILLHVGFRLIGESAAIAADGADRWQPFASLLAVVWTGLDTAGMIVLEHVSWWMALGMILAFLPYLPYSKHLHIITAPINFLTRPERAALGTLDSMDFDDPEAEEFGAQRIEQLGQTYLLDAFACIMCNRCQDVCPAYITGKELSPSALEINKRYLMKDKMTALAAGDVSDQPLLGNAISESAIWACTTCGACVDICPVGNEPMMDIIELRRHQVLTEGVFPIELKNVFSGLERQGNPWQISAERLGWSEGLEVPTVETNPNFEYLYWVGCAPSYEPRAKEVARSFVKILDTAGVNYAVLGDLERCSGDTARRAGHEYLFREMATANINTLNDVDARKVVVTCPHCLHTLGAEYPQLGASLEVIHHTTLISDLLSAGLLEIGDGDSGLGRVTFHDPCYLGRHNGVFADPRVVLESVTDDLVEMPRHGNNSFCCGAGGAQMWKEEEQGVDAVNSTRLSEAQDTDAVTLAVGCPFCLVMLGDANRAAGEKMQVRDVAEIVAEKLL